jgi:hypothetical protein
LGKRRAASNGNAIASPGKKRAFTYRGLKIKPSFVEDERSKQLEEAMREYGLRTHVLAE